MTLASVAITHSDPQASSNMKLGTLSRRKLYREGRKYPF